jgi:hypothetical protein
MLNTRLVLMGSRSWALALATLAAAQIGCGAPPPADPPPQPAATGEAASADTAGGGDVSVDDFVEPLSSYGTWIDDPTYGKIWQPDADVAGENFQPYGSDGSWVANEDGGWTFQSTHDDEFGWATFHYGRWVNHDDYGWVWIPGTEWAPAWVDWRYGGGYVGWAPMGPAGYVVPEERWGFVEQAHFGDSGVWGVRLAPERIHAAFSVAVGVDAHGGGGGHWSVGPSMASLKSAGVSFKTVKVSAPARGALKAMAKASVSKAKASNRPAKAAGAAPVKRGSTAARGNAGSEPKSAGKSEPKSEPKSAGKSEPKSAGKSEPRSEPKTAAKSTPPVAKKVEATPPPKKSPPKKK